MGNIVRDVIAGLEHSELMKIKKDLESGGIHLRKLVNKQIQENEKKNESFCATCFSQIEPSSRNNFTLLFGPEDFRKKASFCGIDCLEYFLNKLKQLEKKG